MNRRDLDAFVGHNELSTAAVEAALDAARARPGAVEVRHSEVESRVIAPGEAQRWFRRVNRPSGWTHNPSNPTSLRT